MDASKASGGSRAPARGKGAKRARRDASGEDDAPVKLSTRRREEAELASLQQRIEEEAPAPGSMETDAKEFSDLPLSRYTLTGLNRHRFRVMTAIQRVSIPHALAGRDILGAAKTGSGKTLGFLVPALEVLHRHRFTAGDGCGAIIISPTRELCAQIFEVLRQVGFAHYSLAAGMVCGGKEFDEEADAIGRMNLLVATPGRLLQHLEQSPDFDVTNVRMLVLDEADRLLDMGFADTLNAILSYLPTPPTRQTLLFSATQTKSVRDLARLSLRDPQFLSVHDKASTATPAKLAQTYVVVALQDKLNMLYSFIRSHLTSKVIVFVSSCKQSRFLFESFRRLRPGVPLQLLHGKMKQQRRMLVYYDFLKKPACVLFATDIAARGLDFPSVDWVLQLDCPEDAATYIHRAGRSARFRSKGHGLLVLLPSEAPAMLEQLAGAKVPLKQVHIASSAAVSVTSKLAAEVAADPELKQLAQRAFSSYVRSVLLQRNKAVFDVAALPMTAYAESLGLAAAPHVKYAAGATDPDAADEMRAEAHARKNENKSLAKLRASIAAKKAAAKSASAAAADDVDDDDDDEDDDTRAGSTDDDDDDDEPEDDEDVLVPRARAAAEVDAEDDELPVAAASVSLTRRERDRIHHIDRMTSLIGSGGATKGADGLTPFQRVAAAKGGAATAATTKDGASLATDADEYAQRVAARLSAVVERDRSHEKARIRQKHRDEKLRAKGILDEGQEEEEADEHEPAVTLGRPEPADEPDVARIVHAGQKRSRVDASSAGTGRPQDLEAAALSMLASRRRG